MIGSFELFDDFEGVQGGNPLLAYFGEGRSRMAWYEHLPIYKMAIDLTIPNVQLVNPTRRGLLLMNP